MENHNSIPLAVREVVLTIEVNSIMVQITKIKKESNKVSKIIFSRQVTEQEAKDLILFSSNSSIYYLIKEDSTVFEGEKYLSKILA